MHLHANIASFFIAHVTIPTKEMVLDGDPISNFERSRFARFHNAADSFVARHKWHAMIIVQSILTLKNTFMETLWLPLRYHSTSKR